MIRRPDDSESLGSLRYQIRTTARQVAEHRHAARLHRAALGERLHAGLASPGMLLFAGSAGFVIAEFAGRAGREQDSGSPGKSRWPTMAGARQALSFALQVYRFAHLATETMGVVPRRSHDRTSLPFA